MDKGHVDYVVTGQPIAIHLLSKVSESFLIEQDPNKTTEYSIGVPKKSVFLLQAINRTLLDLARSGRLAYLQRQWL
jgi:ABC-type amino acid transport substrate-binding protein